MLLIHVSVLACKQGAELDGKAVGKITTKACDSGQVCYSVTYKLGGKDGYSGMCIASDGCDAQKKVSETTAGTAGWKDMKVSRYLKSFNQEAENNFR